MASNFNDIVKQGYVKIRSRKLGASSEGQRYNDLGRQEHQQNGQNFPNFGHF